MHAISCEKQLKSGRALNCSCTKTRYDRPSARRVSFQDSNTLGEEIVAYRCRRCGWWHVGHPPGAKYA